MDRVPGHAWLMVLAAVVVVTVASAAPFASAPAVAAQVIGTEYFGISPTPTAINPRSLVGAGAFVFSGLLLLLFFYRRRLYILFWVNGWVLLGVSMIIAGRAYANHLTGWLAYGIAQFLGLVSALMFVVSADAYPSKVRIPHNYAYVIVPVFLWFALSPLALGPSAVFAPGHVLTAGGLAAAGLAYLMMVRQVRMLGAAVVGASLLTIAGSHVWIVVKVSSPSAPGASTALFFSMIPYLIAALGMQLMTFEEMTLELRRTNRRLETAQGKLRRMVITDPLTGCHNRRFFDEIIGREMQRHDRHGIPLSVLFIDIDRFKAVNDVLGHDAGDEVLRKVAAYLLSNIREADYVFRWGGDEFLILMSCVEDEARTRGLALQKGFAKSVDMTSLPSPVGLSIGCAELTQDMENVLALIRLADERMYEDKRSVVRLESSVPPSPAPRAARQAASRASSP
jgi:diguanylate cyclase (GGDEF)-like protein